MKISRSIRLTAVLVAVLFAALLAAAPVWAQDDPPGRVARLSYTQGTVSLQLSGADEWNQASPNYPLTTGDRVYTDDDGRAELDLGNIAVQLSSDTDLTVANLNDQFFQVGISQGLIRVHVYEILGGNGIEVDTPNGALTLLEPGDYRVETYPDNNTTLVSAFRGRLEINGGDFSQTLDNGEAVKLYGTDQIAGTMISLPEPDEFDRWCETRNQRDFNSDSARYVSPDVPGYRDLDRHGRWVVTSQYGPVWYPGDVSSDWAPYRYGRWVWIEPWGWTWVDDAPWGFTPFHYGRWTRYDSRWCWVPGQRVARPVYAPALVAFVGGRNFSISIGFGQESAEAWFPLGPHEAYYPWYHHDDDYLRRVNVTNITNITNINRIENVDNIHYVNRNFGTTVVPAAAMRNGQPVPRQIIRLTPQQNAQAQIIPHPTVTPSPEAAVGGRPAKAPPVHTPRVVFNPSVARVRQGTASPANRPERPVVTGTAPVIPSNPAPPTRPAQPSNVRVEPFDRGNAPNVSRPSQPPSVNRPAPPVRVAPAQPEQPVQRISPNAGPVRRGNAPNVEQPTQQRLITRTPPPPANPPFAKQQPALQQHPGRPLEPRQVDNIRAGRPAGPMRDREVPAHPTASQNRSSKPTPSSVKEAKPSKPDKMPDRKRN